MPQRRILHLQTKTERNKMRNTASRHMSRTIERHTGDVHISVAILNGWGPHWRDEDVPRGSDSVVQEENLPNMDTVDCGGCRLHSLHPEATHSLHTVLNGAHSGKRTSVLTDYFFIRHIWYTVYVAFKYKENRTHFGSVIGRSVKFDWLWFLHLMMTFCLILFCLYQFWWLLFH